MWLERALQSSLAAFGQQVHARVAAVESQVQAAAARADTAAQVAESAHAAATHATQQSEGAVAAAARVDASMDTLRTDLEALRLELWTHVAGQRAGGSDSQPSTLVARLANLGWDDAGDVLLRRADEVLAAARVPREAISALSAVVGLQQLGSACEGARVAVRGLRMAFGNGRPVWLDRKQSAADQRTVRAVHRAYEVLADVEATMQPSLPVVKDVPARSILAGRQRVLFVSRGDVQWTRYGASRYDEEDRRLVAAFASA